VRKLHFFIFIFFSVSLYSNEIATYLEAGKKELLDIYEYDKEVSFHKYYLRYNRKIGSFRTFIAYKNEKIKHKENTELSSRQDIINLKVENTYGKKEKLKVGSNLLIRNKDRISNDFQEYNLLLYLNYSNRKIWEAGASIREEFFDYWTYDKEEKYLKWFWKGYLLNRHLTIKFSSLIGTLKTLNTNSKEIRDNSFNFNILTGKNIVEKINFNLKEAKRTTLDILERDDDELYKLETYRIKTTHRIKKIKFFLTGWKTEKNYINRDDYYDHTGKGIELKLSGIKIKKLNLIIKNSYKRMNFEDILSLTYIKKLYSIKISKRYISLKLKFSNYNYLNEITKNYNAYDLKLSKIYPLKEKKNLKFDFTFRYRNYKYQGNNYLFSTRISFFLKI